MTKNKLTVAKYCRLKKKKLPTQPLFCANIYEYFTFSQSRNLHSLLNQVFLVSELNVSS